MDDWPHERNGLLSPSLSSRGGEGESAARFIRRELRFWDSDLLRSAARTRAVMKWLKKIALGIATLILLLFVVSLFLPGKWRVERSLSMRADSAAIYPYLANLKRWPEWTPWTKEKDPTLEWSFEGATEGTGAIQRWKSKKFGSGVLRL